MLQNQTGNKALRARCGAIRNLRLSRRDHTPWFAATLGIWDPLARSNRGLWQRVPILIVEARRARKGQVCALLLGLHIRDRFANES